MSGGLTNTGFVATTTAEEVDDLNGKVLANVDAALDLSPDQPIGQLIGIFADKYSSLMQVVATIYDSFNPDAAEGALLANVAAISGTRPQVATYSLAVVNLSLNAGVTVTAGAVGAVAGQPTNTWVLVTTVTNPGGSPAVISGIMRSNAPGPFAANAHTLTVINTPVIGWTALDNPFDATPGLSADTDTTLRQKREIELLGEGSGDTAAIASAVLKSDPNIISAFCFENDTLVMDATGLPGKAFRVVVWDGVSALASNTAIANAIWSRKPSGIQSFGSIATTITDSQGNSQIVYFDRAAQLPLWVTCTTTPSTLTTAGTAAVKAALAAYALKVFGLGVSVIDLPFRAAALVPGVTTDVPTFAFDFHASPTNTGNLAVSGLQIATLSTTNILVNGI